MVCVCAVAHEVGGGDLRREIDEEVAGEHDRGRRGGGVGGAKVAEAGGEEGGGPGAGEG